MPPSRLGRVTLGVVFAVWIPVVVFAVLAWEHRWMSDDGFINLRVVWNVLHGDGPVFNAGERVEAGTSPLWIAILVVARIPLFFLDAAWVAVLVGIALSLVGVAFASLGARRWWASMGEDAVLPLGVGLLIVLPPMWDFASSGLETGLSFAWLGMSWWSTARRLVVDDAADEFGPPPVDQPWWSPVLIGLGPLVRPDLLLFSIAFAIAHVAASGWRGNRQANLRGLALFLALPGAYQVFRMGYYGLLVPNTALAKEAGRDLSSRGHVYLDIFLRTTLLRVSGLVLVVLFLAALADARPSRRHMVVAASVVVGGVLHAYYVVRVGGDFMYARMLLPATFAIALPAAALPVPAANRKVLWAPVVALAVTLVVAGGFRRWDPDDPYVKVQVGDEREAWREISGGRGHPVSLDDYEDAWAVRRADRAPLRDEILDLYSWDRAPASHPVIDVGAVGMVAVKLFDVHISDAMSLTEPVGAHLEPGELVRAGHEKRFPWAWMLARFGEEPLGDPDAVAAREALHCGDLGELVDAVSEPLTPGRFLRNLVGSPARTTLRIPTDPQEARERFCEDGITN